jgi:phage major head subunit gpT-like protein
VEITFPALETINAAVSLAYNTQFFAAERRCDPFTFDATSTGAEEVYPRLDLIGGLREWIGDRVVEQLSISTFTIKNKWFEKTISVDRADIEDDKFGFLAPAAMQLGQNAAQLKDLLVAALLKNGHSTVTYDGQNFFDVAHPNPNADGSAGTVANYQAGSGPSWYLFDTSRVIKPFIWQMRRPFQIIPKFSMTDPQVFWNKEFEWGVDGRCNAGYGLWQIAFRSDAPMTIANVTAARTAMASIRRPNGTPMGIKPDLLVVPTALYPDARAYSENEFVPIDSVTGAATLAPNPLRGLFKALENEWLN